MIALLTQDWQLHCIAIKIREGKVCHKEKIFSKFYQPARVSQKFPFGLAIVCWPTIWFIVCFIPGKKENRNYFDFFSVWPFFRFSLFWFKCVELKIKVHSSLKF